jgi:molybdopterin biosynthesis enzyme MoaB
MIVCWVSVSRRAHVPTVSDSVAAVVAKNRSGGALVEQLASADFIFENATTVPEGAESVARAPREIAVDFSGLIVTTGGIEHSPSDQTPRRNPSRARMRGPGTR